MKYLKEVLVALQVLSDTPSNNEKIVLLKEYCNSNLFKQVCKFALENHRNYHMAKLPDVPVYEEFENSIDIFNQLDFMSNSTGATNSDKNALLALAQANMHAYEVIDKIVKKDLKCGVSAKTINKACPGLIKEWPYMRCQSSTENNLKRIKYPAQVEEKCDGTHIDVVIKNGKVSFMSRKGRPMEFHGVLDEFFADVIDGFDHVVDDIVFIGEGLVSDENGKILPRKQGNGIINKAIKGTITKEEAENVCLTLWDAVPYKDFINGYCMFTQKQRFEKLQLEFSSAFDTVVDVVDYEIVENEKEAIDFYKDIRQDGGEGAIVKNFNGVFKNHTSPNQVKIKAEYEAEFEIIDWKYGEPGTKYKEVLGAIHVESENGAVMSWVGSGFSDQERKELCTDKIIGEIVTIKFESLITKKTSDIRSLFLPRFIEIRVDKWEPNTINYLLELTS